MKTTYTKFFASVIFAASSSMSLAEAPSFGAQDAEILQAPAPVSHVEVPVVTHECNSPVVADIYSVTGLEQCGKQVSNSRLAGIRNRLFNKCANEYTVATVYASTERCEDCKTRQIAKDIRIKRIVGVPCADICKTEGYIEQQLSNLTSLSNRVRIQSISSLRDCGYRVVHTRGCVENEVPSIVVPALAEDPSAP